MFQTGQPPPMPSAPLLQTTTHESTTTPKEEHKDSETATGEPCRVEGTDTTHPFAAATEGFDYKKAKTKKKGDGRKQTAPIRTDDARTHQEGQKDLRTNNPPQKEKMKGRKRHQFLRRRSDMQNSNVRRP